MKFTGNSSIIRKKNLG